MTGYLKVGAVESNLWGRKGYFPRKKLCNKFSPYKYSLAVGRLYFPLPCCHRLGNRKFGTWNWKT